MTVVHAVLTVAAVVAGVLTLGLVASLRPERSDDAADRATLGFVGLMVAGPVWIGQAVLTAFAGSTWLWVWWVAAPLVGLVVPRPRARPATGVPGLGEALRLEMVLGWEELGSPPGWEPQRTPPLPGPDGSRVWFCYAEAPDTPAVVQVAAPWARLDLPADASAPRRTQLATHLEPLGPQAIVPIRPGAIAPADVLAEWRSTHGLVAAHPLVASHLP